MKHIKTFESFINEAIKFNPKPFEKVKPGNTAYTVGDTNAWEVIATGYGDDYDSKLKKHDESGVVGDMKKNPKSYGLTPEEFSDLEFIAIKHGGDTMVFTYDDGGAWVNESENSIEDAEFQAWYDETDHNDPILKKYAAVLKKELPKSMGDLHVLDRKKRKTSTDELADKGLFPATNWDSTPKEEKEVKLAWDDTFGMVIMLDTSRYIAFDYKKAIFFDDRNGNREMSSDKVFSVWKNL